MIILAWILGVGGIIFNFLIYQQTKRKELLSVKLIADILWSLHYIFLGAWSGAAICAVGIVRESIFLNESKAWAKGTRWLLVFLFLSIVSAIFTWKNVYSLLPAISSAISVFSFWRGNPKLTKILVFPISGCFMVYNIACLSYAGIVNEIVVLSSAVIGLLKTKNARLS